MDKLHPYCLIRDDLRISAEGIQCNIVILKTDMFEKKMKRKHDSFQLLQRSFKNRFFKLIQDEIVCQGKIVHS